jgi:P4 family phage/plasmid primase-like protien
MTDLANAELMQKLYGDILRYTPEWGWCAYDGSRWDISVEYRAYEAARDIVKAMLNTANKEIAKREEQLAEQDVSPDSDHAKRVLKPYMEFKKHALKSQSERGLTAMVKLNREFMVASADMFDADPWLLNTPGGVVDLRTGEMMEHNPSYYMRNMTTVTPEAMPTPMWDEFLDTIMCGDKELIRYLQVLMGSALVGKVYVENLVIAYGCGQNGKSTFFNTVLNLVGSYGTAINPDLLMSSKPNEQQLGMAMLEGKRLAVAQESEEGERLRASMLKKLVSVDRMVAKRLYHDPHEFTPTHTLVMATNHLPRVTSTDEGTWRRIRVIPFEAVIPKDRIITDFQTRLTLNEGAGILTWLIEGATLFWENECALPAPPERMVAASEEYRAEEDTIMRFLSESCERIDKSDKSLVVLHKDLYRAYETWCRLNGEMPKRLHGFTRTMHSAGFESELAWYDAASQSKQRAWFGLQLKNKQGPPF